MAVPNVDVALDAQGYPLDRICLHGVAATGYHGVLDHERAAGQLFRADVVLHGDLRAAAREDDLGATIDYGMVAQLIVGILSGPAADLIETVTERIAARLLALPAVQVVDVTVHKPQAPIPVPFEDVSVTIRRDRSRTPAVPAAVPASGAVPAAAPAPATAVTPMIEAPAVPLPEMAPSTEAYDGRALDRMDETPDGFVEVVLALGGNLGNVQQTLRDAVTDLDRTPGLEITEVSPLARSAAVADHEQPDYLNAVLLARTHLSGRELLQVCRNVESAHGRVRGEKWAPRTLDIDIIVYGSLTDVSDDLELPHPRAHERAFVLEPWSQVDPTAVLPGLGGGPVAALAATAPDRSGIRWLALDWLTEPVPETSSVPVQRAPEPVAAEQPPTAGVPQPEHSAFPAAPSHHEPASFAPPPVTPGAPPHSAQVEQFTIPEPFAPLSQPVAAFPGSDDVFPAREVPEPDVPQAPQTPPFPFGPVDSAPTGASLPDAAGPFGPVSQGSPETPPAGSGDGTPGQVRHFEAHPGER